ncbi:MAG: CPBP family intramembrane metalloprotease [Anaerolineae bacterium]|nr:CPBP family intramembrane metalloprotease [Anaerolineae bacterium]MDW8069836.1 CPBP family intramembrane glutamic endopeptidase [Anaerolineae bacterium]
MILLHIFWNPRERRLRMLWRLLGQLVVLMLLTVALTVFAMIVTGLSSYAVGEALFDTEVFSASASLMLTGTLVTTAAALASVWVAGRLLDRRPFAGFGFHLSCMWWQDLAFGLVLGALLMTAVFLVEWAAGWITLSGFFRTESSGEPFVLAFLTPLLLFICVGIYEETLMRGYLLRNLSEGLHLSWMGRRGAILAAWLISSIIFGVLHAVNPNASWMSTFNLVVAGLFLGLGYVLTGELALPIGLHITWNLFQGNVYGFPVSGVAFNRTTVIAVVQGGPDWVTGGAFGPEAGLIGLLATLLGGALTVVWVRRRRGMLTFDPSLAQPPQREG